MISSDSFYEIRRVSAVNAAQSLERKFHALFPKVIRNDRCGGGEFLSPRNGPNGGYTHHAIDLNANPNDQVIAPFDCNVILAQEFNSDADVPKDSRRWQILVNGADNSPFESYAARFLYVKNPNLKFGDVILAGARIGDVQDVKWKYCPDLVEGWRGYIHHIHLEMCLKKDLDHTKFRCRDGTRLDPTIFLPSDTCSKCETWFQSELRDQFLQRRDDGSSWLDKVNEKLPCPCTIRFLDHDEMKLEDPFGNSWIPDASCWPGFQMAQLFGGCSKFHPGAHGCIRSETVIRNLCACCFVITCCTS
jgi:hypothetical protein